MISGLLGLLVVIGIIAIIYWGYTQIAPGLPRPLQVIMIVVIVIVAIWLLIYVAGMLGVNMHLPK